MTVLGTEIDLERIHVDSYVVAGSADHICPWEACYRSARLLGGKARFVLSTNGHIAALVNPPGNPKSSYRLSDDITAEATDWAQLAPTEKGSGGRISPPGWSSAPGRRRRPRQTWATNASRPSRRLRAAMSPTPEQVHRRPRGLRAWLHRRVPIFPKERAILGHSPSVAGGILDRRGSPSTVGELALRAPSPCRTCSRTNDQGDARPRDAIEIGRARIRGELRMTDAQKAAFQANAAARGLVNPAKLAALGGGPSGGGGSARSPLPPSVNSWTVINNAGGAPAVARLRRLKPGGAGGLAPARERQRGG